METQTNTGNPHLIMIHLATEVTTLKTVIMGPPAYNFTNPHSNMIKIHVFGNQYVFTTVAAF